MEKRKRTKKFKEGEVYAIPLNENEDEFAFGLVCRGRDFAFFAHKSINSSIPEGLLELPFAFRVIVAEDTPKSGNWLCLGSVELTGRYAANASYIRKPIGSDQCYIYTAGEERPADIAECKGLEILGVWFSMHVRQRLLDYFAGRENDFVLAVHRQLGLLGKI
ncbi:hypothetical protein [Chitinivorax sp. B]|uniref:hypothetical protein n=1 Tax=Chitinivorax sp. B TaxID=2502235 RepID=UPI0010F88DAE|nr:hypothetical protein [Chitinivorax sp. B]